MLRPNIDWTPLTLAIQSRQAGRLLIFIAFVVVIGTTEKR